MSNTRPSDAIAQALAERYRDSVKALNEYRYRMFPKGEKVYVDADSYRGPGVARDSGCPPDRLPVLLENGFTWWYPIERCYHVGMQCGMCWKPVSQCSCKPLPCEFCHNAVDTCTCSEHDIDPDFGAKG